MTMMKKRLSHFAYNERSRSGWTLSISLQNLLSPIRSTTMKTVTYVLGTFVTLVPGPNTPFFKGGIFSVRFLPLFNKEGKGRFSDGMTRE
jgi:hypothetical protein